MMKKVILTLLLLICLTFLSTSQNSFEIGIDSEEDCIVQEADIDSNGNVIIVGYIGSFIELDYDAFVLKVNPDGSYSTKRFDRQDTVSVFSTVDVLPNGNYFIKGSYSLDGNYFHRDHLWIMIIDTELNIILDNSYKVKEPYLGFSNIACSLLDNDGNIVITTSAGKEDEDKTIFTDFAFFKLNQQGDTLTSKYYSYLWDELPWELRIMPNSDNLMLIEKSTNGFNHNELMFLDPDLNILKINPTGNDMVSLLGNLSSDYWVSDTSFLLSGRNDLEKCLSTDYYIGVYLVDTSANFHQELVLNKIDTTDYPAWYNSMAYANDSTIYIGGFQSTLNLWDTDPTIVELYVIDKNMNLLGYKELGGDANYDVWGIIATDDDGCLLYGSKYDNELVLERDVHIWKVLRAEINIITELTESIDETTAIEVFPNPVTDGLNIKLDRGHDWDKLTLSIFAIEGKKVFQKQINGNGNLLKADLHNLVPGLYVIQISNKDQIIYSEKIIKQ